MGALAGLAEGFAWATRREHFSRLEQGWPQIRGQHRLLPTRQSGVLAPAHGHLGANASAGFGRGAEGNDAFVLQVCFKNAFCGFTKSGLRGARIAQFARHVATNVRNLGH